MLGGSLMFALSIKAETAKFAAALSAVASKQLPYAISRALNDTAQDVLADNKRLMTSVFDRPTPFTLNAFYAKPATQQSLSTTVQRKDQVVGKHYLETEASGGARGQTGIDKLLSMRIAYAGHLWGVVPGDGARLDAYGNWSSAERNQVLAVLKAMRDGAANETTRSRKRAGSARARYFVSPPSFKTPGIWKRIPGQRQPSLILLFVGEAPGYQARFPFHANAERVAREAFPKRFAQRFNAALASAR